MCYSPEVSFGTWLVGIIASLYLYYNKKPFLFPLVVSQMQLIEGLRWIQLIDENILAILGKLVLYSQPIAAFYEAKQYSFIFPYILVQSFVEVMYGSRDLRFKIANDGHFEWKWIRQEIETVPYWIGLVLGASFILPPQVLLIFLGLYAYFYIHHVKYKTHGSLWCVSVNLLWIYYLFI